jgi:hypothetical protein
MINKEQREKLIEEGVEKLKQVISEDRLHLEDMGRRSRDLFKGYNRSLLMIEEFAPEILSNILSSTESKGEAEIKLPYEKMWKLLKSESGYRSTEVGMGVDRVRVSELMTRMENRVEDFITKPTPSSTQDMGEG